MNETLQQISLLLPPSHRSDEEEEVTANEVSSFAHVYDIHVYNGRVGMFGLSAVLLIT